jgi:nucleoside-diphosphate-sugar epimerase
MRRVFVTGGSGFVGRNLLEALQARQIPTVALARSDASAAACAGHGARVARGDLDDVEAMAAAMTGCDVVFHCAAHVLEWDRPEVFQRVNVDGTANVIAAAKRARVERLVHVSTEAVLVGAAPYEPIVAADEGRPIPATPLPLYPASKAAAEHLVRKAAADLHTVIVRPRFIWGAGDTSLLPQLIEAVLARRFRWIAGGNYKTSTCHVRNCVEGMLRAAERGGRGETYFLTDGPPVELRGFLRDLISTQGFDAGHRTIPRGVARALASAGEALGRLRGYRWRPPITHLTLRLMGEEVTVNDAKARAEIGYTGAVKPQDGLTEMRHARATTVSETP